MSKTNNVTNNVTNTPDTDVLNQVNQDYFNRRDQQYIARKYDNGLERVTLDLAPDIILEEEEEDGFYEWADNYDQWNNTGNKTGGSHIFNSDDCVFNLTKTKQNKKLKTRIVSEVSESNNKSDFYIGKRQS